MITTLFIQWHEVEAMLFVDITKLEYDYPLPVTLNSF